MKIFVLFVVLGLVAGIAAFSDIRKEKSINFGQICIDDLECPFGTICRGGECHDSSAIHSKVKSLFPPRCINNIKCESNDDCPEGFKCIEGCC